MFEKRINIVSILLAILLSVVSSPAWAAVSRTVGGDDCNPVVTVTVTPEAGASAWAYEEHVYGLEASSTDENVVWSWNPGILRWGAFLSNEPLSFSYTLSGHDGSYSIFGIESGDGVDSHTDSTSVTIDCGLAPPAQVAAPVFDPPGGSVVAGKVAITTTTLGATIYYTADETIPTSSSSTYENPIAISGHTLLQAIAVKEGMIDSEVARGFYYKPFEPPALTLERSVADTACSPVVTITVTPSEAVSAYAVEEILPPGSTPVNRSENGVWDEESSTIRWGVFLDGEPRVLTYELTGPDASYSLTGAGDFDGRGQEISGEDHVVLDCMRDKAATPFFYPPAGERTPVWITMATNEEGATIRYTTDGSAPDEYSTIYTGSVNLDEAVTIKARALKPGLEPSDVATAYYPPAKRPMAIIVAGRDPSDGDGFLWSATRAVTNYAYIALLLRGYLKEDIRFLSHDRSEDVDKNGKQDDIYKKANRENLMKTIEDLAVDASEMLLFFTGPGAYETFTLGGSDTPGQNDILNATELDGWLDSLQNAMPHPGKLIVIYDACQSGTFLPHLAPPDNKERVVVTSVSNKPAIFLGVGVLSFSHQFWSWVFYNGNLREAHIAGGKLLKEFMGIDPGSRIDADGDCIANEDVDLEKAKNIVIGRGITSAPKPATIQFVSVQLTLTTTSSAYIQAGDFISTDQIGRVWAEVIPPGLYAGDPNIPITDSQSLTITMTDPDTDGIYEGGYAGFTQSGEYRPVILAMDTQGVLATPVSTSVFQPAGALSTNSAPTVANMTFSTDEDASIHSVLAASDDEGNNLTYLIVGNGDKGTATMTDVKTGAFIYQPHSDKSGADEFTFIVNDGNQDSAVGTVSITIHSVEDAPRARDVQLTVIRNESVNGNLDAVDPDGDSITFEAAEPSHGIVDNFNEDVGSFTYTPNAGYFGADSFTFTAKDDGNAVSPPAVVRITIDRGYNNPPSASGASFSFPEDTVFSGDLDGSDPDNDSLTFVLVSAPAKGEVEFTDSSQGSFTYTPYADSNGEDLFAFKVRDSFAESVPETCEISITPVNDTPVAIGGVLIVDSPSGAAGVLIARDIEKERLTFSIAENGEMGAVIIDPVNGAFFYTPNNTENGTDRFTFTASDGVSESDPAEVVVNIILPRAEIRRALSEGECGIDVELSVAPVASVESYAVEEILPYGVIPTGISISHGGFHDATTGTIRWGAFLDNESRVLSYRLTGVNGDHVFSGAGGFDGRGHEVSGDVQAIIACGEPRASTPVFNSQGNNRAPVDVSITSETTGAEIRYTTDGGIPSSDSLHYTSPLHFDQSVFIKARAYKEGVYGSPVAEVEYLPPKRHKAIIVAGGGPYPENELWDATSLISNYSYSALQTKGYTRDDILFLSVETVDDLAGNGGVFDGIGNLKSAFRVAVEEWALDAKTLLLFITDHGEDSILLLDGTGKDPFTQDPDKYLGVGELNSWLSELQKSMDGLVTIVYDACQAGSFLDPLKFPLAPPLALPSCKKRIVITGASHEKAWFLDDGRISFSYQFWASIFGRSGIYKDNAIYFAFYDAKEVMGKFQTALIYADADGDCVEDVLPPPPPNPPIIGGVSRPQRLQSESSATIKAWDISTSNGVQKILAIIIPPDCDPDASTTPVTEMPEVELLDPDGDGKYEVEYHEFTSDGRYDVLVFAIDDDGVYSLPANTSITKNSLPPDAHEDDNHWQDAKVILLNDADSPPRTFHGEGDIDWARFYGLKDVVYEIEAVNTGRYSEITIALFGEGDLVNPIERLNEGKEEDVSLTWSCLDDGVYYLMISHLNTDVYCFVGSYDFEVYRAMNTLPGYIEGVVVGADGQPIEGALIRTNRGGSAISLSDGSYKMAHEAGTVEITARASGYNPRGDSVEVIASVTSTLNFMLALLPSPPAKAISPGPVNGALNAPVNTDVRWTDGGGAASYNVYFGTDSTPDNDEFIGNQEATAHDPGLLVYETTYYWRIDARNASGLTTGDVWSFTTKSPPPSKAVDPAPANSAEGRPLDTYVSWGNGGGAASYDVYFGTDPTPDNNEFIGNQAPTAYDPGPLDYGSTYYWRIDARNSGGATVGDVWRFTTGGSWSFTDFSANPLAGPTPLLVQFTDLSTNGPTSWAWDFNDDGIVDSAERNPACVYAIADTYSVSLSVTGSEGFDEETKFNYIEVWECENPPARIQGNPPVYFPSLKEAYDAALDGETIECQGVIFPGGLDIDDDKSVGIVGGYRCDYSAHPMAAGIQGTMTIRDGTVILEKGALEIGP